jgi:hypothetical protein
MTKPDRYSVEAAWDGERATSRVIGYQVIDRGPSLDQRTPHLPKPVAWGDAMVAADWLNEGWNAASADSGHGNTRREQLRRELAGWLRMLLRPKG